ncbi:Zinc finger protein CONSTANS-LIKE 4 [Apostasia shenzhenica]|uniref:Zinc finger protein CONSTANS-LIKE 4 n=1 Tax=Apostasia shenzhenica TaxID=1088818 RepID=A0A2H9ZYY6_9ASPA|nr:Zinc finger protein CONSTANS-LIKE 4 [Apostasia shenzhenica]
MYHSTYSSSPYNSASFIDAGDGDHHPPPSLFSSSLPTSFYLHRSNSSHSLPLLSLFTDRREFLDLRHEPVRRVFSTGDLQQCMNGSSSSTDASTCSGLGKVVRYSAEERRERIERYRSKRNHRNFQKKITYACRKTLADSRPRVRGRFARNGETEHEAEAETEGGIEWWNNCEVAGNGDDWLGKMQAAPVTEDEEECGYDEDLWASLESVFAMNLSSSGALS